MPEKGFLERLAEGPVVGDGSMCMTLEKRGYCRAGGWTPEAVLLYPDAVRQLLREYLRSGADVLQAPCFNASDGKLRQKGAFVSTSELNKAACKMTREVANEGNALVCGGLSPVPCFANGEGEVATREEFRNQIRIQEDECDILLAEYFNFVDEIVICIDEMKRTKLPVCASMCIGPLGDGRGVSVEECAIRMARAGADVIGLNCNYDIDTVLKTLKRMKVALDKEGLSPYLMCQPLGWRCLEVENHPRGYLSLPDCPLSLDSRTCTRYEIHKFARSAYEIGARYIGGCCGMEPHHIRAIAQELAPERKKDPPVNDMCLPYGPDLKLSSGANTRRKNKEFWMNVKPASGRPFNPCFQTMENMYE